MEQIEERTQIPINIFRYKFSQDFMNELSIFSKVHQYDDRHTFKEAWDKWVIEYEDIVKEEMNILMENRYEGDILDKMFKSARYYFRKKSTEKKTPKERRTYIHVEPELLEAMDTHIAKKIVLLKGYQPKSGFANFCEENMDVLRKNVAYICSKGVTDSTIIQDKIKKTYKNRYFMLITNQKEEYILR